MRPSEIIREGRNVLFERGWTQNAYVNDGGSVCAMGALAAASGHLVDWWVDAEKYLQKALPASADFVSVWNDEPGRTLSEVVDLFDRAEKLAEADEVAP